MAAGGAGSGSGNGPRASMLPIPGATWGSVAERRAERAVEAVGQEAKRQARNVDPGMETVKAGFVAGERKADASIRPRSGESLQRAWTRRSGS